METERLLIRDFVSKDEILLKKIIWQESMVRFMRDWSENSMVPGRLRGYIDWLGTQTQTTDVYENKRYAIVLKETNLLISMVGMGLEDTLNEVEMTYFIDKDYQGKGYATEALIRLFDWCMSISSLPYMILTIDCLNQASCRVAEKAGLA